MEFAKHQERKLLYYISTPIIYSMIIPFICIDIIFETYHNICFRLYGIPLIERSRYIKIDRYKLKYLKLDDKINCAYCGYGNGLINYVQAIVGKTEEFWCGIKHEKDEKFIEPKHHEEFVEYDNEEKLKEKFQIK